MSRSSSTSTFEALNDDFDLQSLSTFSDSDEQESVVSEPMSDSDDCGSVVSEAVSAGVSQPFSEPIPEPVPQLLTEQTAYQALLGHYNQLSFMYHLKCIETNDRERNQPNEKVNELKEALRGGWRIVSEHNAEAYFEKVHVSEQEKASFLRSEKYFEFYGSNSVSCFDMLDDVELNRWSMVLSVPSMSSTEGSITYITENSMKTIWISKQPHDQEESYLERFIKDGRLHLIRSRAGVICTRIYEKIPTKEVENEVEELRKKVKLLEAQKECGSFQRNMKQFAMEMLEKKRAEFHNGVMEMLKTGKTSSDVEALEKYIKTKNADRVVLENMLKELEVFKTAGVAEEEEVVVEKEELAEVLASSDEDDDDDDVNDEDIEDEDEDVSDEDEEDEEDKELSDEDQEDEEDEEVDDEDEEVSDEDDEEDVSDEEDEEDSSDEEEEEVARKRELASIRRERIIPPMKGGWHKPGHEVLVFEHTTETVTLTKFIQGDTTHLKLGMWQEEIIKHPEHSHFQKPGVEGIADAVGNCFFIERRCNKVPFERIVYTLEENDDNKLVETWKCHLTGKVETSEWVRVSMR